MTYKASLKVTQMRQPLMHLRQPFLTRSGEKKSPHIYDIYVASMRNHVRVGGRKVAHPQDGIPARGVLVVPLSPLFVSNSKAT
jgi:hypothetical protein